MTSKNKCRYFRLNPTTIYDVRKEYDLHTPGAIDRAIDNFSDWIQKQEHFAKIDLPREYLERCIIASKGSLEKAKTRMEKLYTMRTMTPELFAKSNAIKHFPNLRNFFLNVCMPNLTEDHCRIHIGKFMSSTITPTACFEAFQHCRIMCEYAKLYDYCKGYHVIYDLRDVSIADIIGNIDWVKFRIAITAILEGYGFRIMSIYILSTSAMINVLIKLLKQMLSEKISNRIHVAKDMDSLPDFVSRKLLPKDYGGELKSILELYDEMNEDLATEENIAYMEAMKDARTIEELRSSDSFDKEFLGMPGSFKMLNVD